METAVAIHRRITVISNRNFGTEILNTEKPVLLMCASDGQAYADQTLVLKQVLDMYDDALGVCRLEEDFINGFKQMYNIKGTPIFLLFDKGKELGRMLGMADQERLKAFLARNLPQPSADFEKNE